MKKSVVKDPSVLTSFFLRVAIAVPFLYAAVDATLEPQAWLGFMPAFLVKLLPGSLLLLGFSLYEFELSLWILSGWKIKYASGIAVLTLLAIIVANISALYIVFRDVGLMFAALGLHALNHNRK